MTDTQRLPGISSSDDVDTSVYDVTDDTESSTDFEGGENENGNDESSNPQKPSKTPEQLEHERKVAVRESLKNNQKAKTAQAQVDAQFTTLLNTAKRNPAILDALYETDPTLADSLTSQLPQYQGMTYQEALAYENKKSQPSDDSNADIAELVAKEVEKTLQQKVSQETQDIISNVETELFMSIAQQFDPKSFQYKKILAEYKSFGTPSTEKQARAYFKAAKDVLRDEDDSYIDRTRGVPSLSMKTGRSNDTLPMPSEAFFEQARLAGRDRKTALAGYRAAMAKKIS